MIRTRVLSNVITRLILWLIFGFFTFGRGKYEERKRKQQKAKVAEQLEDAENQALGELIHKGKHDA